MAVAEDKQAGAVAWAKRLWPLLLLLAAMALVFAMGWHRYLTLQELVERREALRASIAGHTAPRHPRLHGDLCRDRRSVACRAPRSSPLPEGSSSAGSGARSPRLQPPPSAPSSSSSSRAAPLASRSPPAPGPGLRSSPRISGGCFQLSPVPAPCPHLPVLARQSRPGASWRGLWTYALATVIGIIPGSFAYSIAGKGLDSLIVAQQAAHQSCLAKMGSDAEELCPFVLEPRACSPLGSLRALWRLGSLR